METEINEDDLVIFLLGFIVGTITLGGILHLISL